MDYSTPCKYSIRLLEKLKSLNTQNVLDFELINKAIYWAKKYHDGQFRKSGEPFYSHPLEVAYMLSDYNLKTDVITASILHDIIEDTEVTVEMIQDTFGERIAEMVDRLTRDRPDGSKLSIKELLNNAYEQRDQEVVLIKLIDRLHNIRTIESMSAKKIENIISETLINFITSSMYLGLLEVEQQLTKSCMYYDSKYKNKPYKIKSIFSFNDNNSPLLSLIS
jgi:(p)ppGpp synthase/HD superfamily hydrolase